MSAKTRAISVKSPSARFFSFLLAVLPATLTVSALANDWVAPYAADDNGLPITQVMPGQIFRIFIGQKVGDEGVGGNTAVTENISFLSVTGGTVDLPQNLVYADASPDAPAILIITPNQQTYPFQIKSLPVTYRSVSDQASSEGFNIWVRAGQVNSAGKAAPVVMKVKMTIVNTSSDTTYVPANYSGTATISVPVSGLPALSVSVKTTTTEPTGILHPNESATYSFQTTADNLEMQTVTFKASIPAGTKVSPGSIFPIGGAVNGNTVVWASPGSQTSFTCGFGYTVSAHPGTKSAVVNYHAATSVLNKPVSKSGSSKIAINNYGEGRIDYAGPSGSVDGDVAVDDQCTYKLNDWDWYGGDVTVKLNGQVIGTGSEESPTGPFTVPVFTKASLESTLSAQQSQGPIDTIVTGAVASTAEFVAGPVEMVNADGTVARRLALHGKVAKGEVVPTDTTSPGRLGHLELGNAASFVVLHYLPMPGAGADLRLIFARQGRVLVYGPVFVSRIQVVGSGTVNYNKESLTNYSTANDPGVTWIFGPTLSQPTTMSGYWNINGNITISGNVTLSSAISYFTGNVTIAPGTTISGTGSIIVYGNLTIQSGAILNLQGSGAVGLGVGGTLIIDK